jgi:hypothetical protein
MLNDFENNLVLPATEPKAQTQSQKIKRKSENNFVACLALYHIIQMENLYFSLWNGNQITTFLGERTKYSDSYVELNYTKVVYETRTKSCVSFLKLRYIFETFLNLQIKEEIFFVFPSASSMSLIVERQQWSE